MTAKKRWVSKLTPESEQQERISNISWSSDTDEEGYEITDPCTNKRIRISSDNIENIDNANESRLKSWIRLHDCSTTPIKPTENEIENESQPSQSPILTNFTCASCSPILPHSSLTREPSPILGRRETIIKNLKSRIYEQEHKIEEDFCVPEVSQTSCVIIDTQSTTQSKEDTIQISQIRSDSPVLSSPVSIDPFPSQKSPPISTTLSSRSGSNSSNDPPTKKRKYKKGGIAHQLQKALHAQKSSLAFWQHEQFLNRTKKELNCNDEGLTFYVISKINEYGCNLFSCRTDNEFEFLILQQNNFSNITICEGGWYKLLQPYSTVEINYRDKECLCYYNCNKFVKINLKLS